LIPEEVIMARSGLGAGETQSIAANANQKNCSAMNVLYDDINDDDSILEKMKKVEEHSDNYKKGKAGAKAGATTTQMAIAASLTDATTIEIPVYVNVIYSNANENISDAQIASQFTVLNQDFRASNSDISKLATTSFAGKGSDFNFHFTLLKTTRKASTKTAWGTRNAMKSAKSGGIDPTNPTTALNIWVCEIGSGLLGYAQFPGGAAATDGVVIGPKFFGNTGTYLSTIYNKGRTATHEVGHWLNLRHIWGDASCGSDLVTDTPMHNTSNYGCPTLGHTSTCTGAPIEMTMNYMDYSDDACMYMFTVGQKDRARAIFAAGGFRAAYVK
jgi:Pregnancy-associated plasma protein-A